MGPAFVSGQILGGLLLQTDGARPRLARDLLGERAGGRGRADRRGARGAGRPRSPPAPAGPALRGRAFSAGTAVNFALVFFFGVLDSVINAGDPALV
jgi:hypothetical protein